MVKAITPRKLDVAGVRSNVIRALETEGREQARLLQGTVSYWSSNPPQFVYDVEMGYADVTLRVYPKEGSAATIWGYINSGTPAHIIQARNAPYLKFRTGYVAGSRPGTWTVAAGYYTGGWRRKLKVRHPGIKARNWTKLLEEDRRAQFYGKLMDAVLDGMRIRGGGPLHR
jgi:hypothetical protein